MTNPIPLATGGKFRVRWAYSAGVTAWLNCDAVHVVGDFVVVNAAERITAIPAHYIRGTVEIEQRDLPDPTTRR